MSLGVSDKQMMTTLEKMEVGKVVESLLVSNDVAYIKYFAAVFDELWDSGINAIERIKDIKEGRETNDELADARVNPKLDCSYFLDYEQLSSFLMKLRDNDYLFNDDESLLEARKYERTQNDMGQ
jgi:hypothetical protein